MLKDLLFPKSCLGCQAWGRYLCPACSKGLTAITHQRCIACQRPSLNGWTHPKCQTRTTPDRLVSVFNYHDSLIAKSINTAKLALVPEIFAELAAQACLRMQFQDNLRYRFVLCPIPQTRSRTRWRGFNQSELIAQVITQSFGAVTDRLLLKSRRTRQQKKLNRIERKQNLMDCFVVASPEYVPNHVLLIDDISTTGSTFLEAAKTLKKAGIQTVWCLALAQD